MADIPCLECSRVLFQYEPATPSKPEELIVPKTDPPLQIRVIDPGADKGVVVCPHCRAENPVRLSLFKRFT